MNREESDEILKRIIEICTIELDYFYEGLNLQNLADYPEEQHPLVIDVTLQVFLRQDYAQRYLRVIEKVKTEFPQFFPNSPI